MFTEIFGHAPRVRLLDFLADHPDFDYTISRHPVTGHHDAEVRYMTIHYVVI